MAGGHAITQSRPGSDGFHSTPAIQSLHSCQHHRFRIGSPRTLPRRCPRANSIIRFRGDHLVCNMGCIDIHRSELWSLRDHINPVETLTVGQIIAIVASAFVGILVLVGVYTNIHEMHSVWKRRRQLYHDVTVADRIFRRCHQLRRDAGRRANEAFTKLRTAAGLGWVVGRGPSTTPPA